ncbi:MAG: hypothetical protein Q7S29_04940 [Candidatus Peribacter sp.]|nr:hypothetical protein [Candidatus Peribacter sp.]
MAIKTADRSCGVTATGEASLLLEQRSQHLQQHRKQNLDGSFAADAA